MNNIELRFHQNFLNLFQLCLDCIKLHQGLLSLKWAMPPWRLFTLSWNTVKFICNIIIYRMITWFSWIIYIILLLPLIVFFLWNNNRRQCWLGLTNKYVLSNSLTMQSMITGKYCYFRMRDREYFLEEPNKTKYSKSNYIHSFDSFRWRSSPQGIPRFSKVI